MFREDQHGPLIEAAIGPIVAKRTTKELVDLKFLVPPRIYTLPVLDSTISIQEPNSWEGIVTQGKRKPKGVKDWHAVYDTNIVNNEYRNAIIEQLAHLCVDRNLLPCLILVKHIAHGQLIYDALSKWLKLEDVVFLTGKNELDERTEVLNKIRSNQLKVLISSPIFNEGTDIPSLRSLIVAGAGKSAIQVFQRVGRTLRIAPNKTEAYIFDFYDFAPIVEKHSKKRVKLYQKEYDFVRELSQGQVADFLRDGTFTL
ncbi:MAG TPA: helicase-related protein [Nitrosopumilaceae archaeon]|nr:helicase-related protein [Nitrosopumilaceae archaeon]